MHILLAEDNEDHARITARAIRSANLEVASKLTVTVVPDGTEVLAYLRGEGRYEGRTLPDLVLLDLKMPGVDGLEVVRLVRADPALQLIPLIMLTSSARDEDVTEAYVLGANEYVTKAGRADEFRAKVQAIPRYWSHVVQRPPRASLASAVGAGGPG
jgi:chemotaxis family two-component system response regulator Rcp1